MLYSTLGFYPGAKESSKIKRQNLIYAHSFIYNAASHHVGHLLLYIQVCLKHFLRLQNRT